MRTDEVLDQIGEALDDWEVGPDAMRCGAPPKMRPLTPGQTATVLLRVDVSPFIEAMQRAVAALAQFDFSALEKAIAQLDAANDPHHPRPLPIDGAAYHRRRQHRRRR